MLAVTLKLIVERRKVDRTASESSGMADLGDSHIQHSGNFIE